MNNAIMRLLTALSDARVTLHLYGLDHSRSATLDGVIHAYSWTDEAELRGKGYKFNFRKQWVTEIKTNENDIVVDVMIQIFEEKKHAEVVTTDEDANPAPATEETKSDDIL